MLSARKDSVLKEVVDGYIATCSPVASAHISPHLGVSSATARNDLASLEDEEYIYRPHTSAGGIPTDKGYRYYVEHLLEIDNVSEEEREEIVQAIFSTNAEEFEEWVERMVQILARRIGYFILVTPPQGRFFLKHVSLIPLQEFLALLVLVLSGARIRKQLISLDRAVSQDELDFISNKINYLYSGYTWNDILSSEEDFSPMGSMVVNNVAQLMQGEETKSEEVWASGLSYLLNQPEFSYKEMLPLVETWEEKEFWGNVLDSSQKIKVSIGSENKDYALHNLSLITGGYAVPGERRGAVGVVGPTRMDYRKVIPWTNLLTETVGDFLTRLYWL